ncbi:MAG: response regulator [Syntrophorhabdaceae bacterium]|nr:response regulator [Syntrophorhabdaceae bacterium]
MNRVCKAKILLIEDEEDVRKTMAELLTALVYDVSCAIEGSEAVGLFRHAMETGNPYDVVVVDYYIPGIMNGAEVMDRLRMVDPGVKAVLVSGCMDNFVIARCSQTGFQGALTKPFVISELDGMLAKLMQKDAQKAA